MSYSSDSIDPRDWGQADMEMKFLAAVKNDDQMPEVAKVIEMYNSADLQTRRLINEMFVHLCGFQLMTLIRTDPKLF